MFLAELAQARRSFNEYYDARDDLREFALKIYEKHNPEDFKDWRYKIAPEGKNVEDAITERWITKKISGLRTRLKNSGAGAASLVPLLPEAGRFSLDLDRSQIKIVD